MDKNLMKYIRLIDDCINLVSRLSKQRRLKTYLFKMKLILFQFLSFAILANFVNVRGGVAVPCNATACAIKDNCRCSSDVGPISKDQAPQLIVLAFVEAVTTELFDNKWDPLLSTRKNPDGDYIGATFYVPHEYTDYQKVADIAASGFEVGVHSISNNAHQEYWRGANQSTLEQEFGGQKQIISKFANIPEKYIQGVMTPQLQINGDESVSAFVSSEFIYDNSWPSATHLFPYTLEYQSTQSCDLGASCPSSSYPGFWETPIIDLTGFSDDKGCATLAACFRGSTNGTVKEISDWLYNEVDKIRKDNGAPVTWVIESNWFAKQNHSYDGLVDALDRLQQEPDVFLVSQARVIEWMKNPVPLSEFTTNSVGLDINCDAVTCKLEREDGEVRYMNSCVPCPKTYPWLGNPLGN